MNKDVIQIQEMTQRFFQQQKQIYGDEFVFSDPDLKRFLWNETGSADLQEFFLEVRNCTRCPLSETRKNVVFGSGNGQANLMLIGEAPGEQEDLQGEAFVGKAGQLLDKILAAIQFGRDEVYIANILKCRPSNNRDPLPREIEQCMPYLKKQIALIRPRIILALGRISAQTLLNTTQSLGQLRKKQHVFQNIPLIVTYHPAALLRHPEWKRATWQDVQRVRKLYDELVGDKEKWTPPNPK